MKKILTQTMKKETAFLSSLFEDAVKNVINDFMISNKDFSKDLFNSQVGRIGPLFDLLKQNYFDGLYDSFILAKMAQDGSRLNPRRVSYFNKELFHYRNSLLKRFPQAGNIWVLDGLVFKNQVAGLKNIVGFNNKEGSVIDVLNCASSISLGAENPWLAKMDYIEDILGIRDNICAAYHPGVRQDFALQRLAKLYPNKKMSELTVHSESSGTIVNSVAIESAVAYVEKQTKDLRNKKILAVNGTWAGGYGSSREGTGFGVDDYQVKKTGKNIWIDRNLPPPIKENRQQFLSEIRKKLKASELAGIYLEPDVVGDLGLITVDVELLREVKKIMKKNNLPIILDCVQQLGRSGSYWGENVDNIFSDYPLLIMTAAKSASNGQPFGFVIMPKIIGDAAYPLTQITTNQMNGPLMRSLVVAEVFNNKNFQTWQKIKAISIEKAASDRKFDIGYLGLRGKFLNRGIYLKDDESVKLAQIALLVEDGILVGATPNTIRYQPMLLEYSETNLLIANIIFNRLNQIKLGNISPMVIKIFNKMHKIPTGLARNTV
jgi:acetylornithine/succinyldiaminopimelate/putrescine aminotransferase